jgi:hypothetical protein
MSILKLYKNANYGQTFRRRINAQRTKHAFVPTGIQIKKGGRKKLENIVFNVR